MRCDEQNLQKFPKKNVTVAFNVLCLICLRNCVKDAQFGNVISLCSENDEKDLQKLDKQLDCEE